jgi:dihydrodipicolinate synthase/N-acetylneuraminate lyase
MTDASELSARLDGVLCATITPFDWDTMSVDWDGVRHNVAWLIDRGIRLLLVNGSIGEPSSLSEDERSRVVRETVSEASGRVVVVVGCSDPNPNVVIDRAHDARATGAAGILVAPPGSLGLSSVEIVDYYQLIDRTCGLPIVVYDNPAISRRSLDLEAIAAIGALPRFAGLKEADPDVLRFQALIDRFGPSFPIVAGVEDPLLFHLVAGATACMTASAAFAPALLADLMAAVATSDLPRARRLYARIRAFRALFAGDLAAGRPAWLPYTKAAVELVGGRGGPPRPPFRGLTAAEVERLTPVVAAMVTRQPDPSTDPPSMQQVIQSI